MTHKTRKLQESKQPQFLNYGYETNSTQHSQMCISVNIKHSKLILGYFQIVFQFIRLIPQLF